MKSLILGVTLTLFSTFQVMACSCECTGDCSFSAISSNSEIVALVKVISYDDYLEGGKRPYSMTVEIIKKYKGTESRKTIKIWGDNGTECRPYISNFKLGEFYLVAPNQLGEYKLEGENSTDYDFFSCNTDYMKVDMDKQKAFGVFTKTRTEIGLKEFEEKVKK